MAAAIVALSLVVLFNLLLTFGVLRRLRELQDRTPQGPITPPLQTGIRAPAFVAHDISGARFSERDLAGGGVLAFLATDCDGCHQQIPTLQVSLASVSNLPVVVVVATAMHGEVDTERSVELMSRVKVPEYTRKVAAIEPLDGNLQAAYQVTDFPTYIIIDDGGIIRATTHDASRVGIAAH